MFDFASKAALALIAMTLLPAGAMAWTTDCKESRCGVSIIVNDATKKQRLMTFAVLINKDGSDAAVIVTTPLGTALEPGARLVATGKDIGLVFKVCYPEGCQAFGALNAADLATLRAAANVDAQFFVQGSDKPLSAKIDLAGLDAELTAIKK